MTTQNDETNDGTILFYEVIKGIEKYRSKLVSKCLFSIHRFKTLVCDSRFILNTRTFSTLWNILLCSPGDLFQRFYIFTWLICFISIIIITNQQQLCIVLKWPKWIWVVKNVLGFIKISVCISSIGSKTTVCSCRKNVVGK